MIALLAIGLVAMTVCLGLQAYTAVVAARYFTRVANHPLRPRPRRLLFRQFATLMLVLMLGNIVQILVWALLYQQFDAFADLETAIYFSGVTFTSLGYGDVVLPRELRLLGPLQAANGLMMFGVTTALFFAAVQAAIRKGVSANQDIGSTGTEA
jgi:hypothetical protein